MKAFVRNIYSKVLSRYALLKLGRIFREVKTLNEANSDLIQDRVRSFLKKWNLPDSLEKNPPQSKADFLKMAQASSAYGKAYKFAYTGGSTGSPLKIPLSKTQDLARKASLAYYNSLVGYQLGRPYVFIRVKDRGWMEKLIRREFAFLPQSLSDAKIEELAQLIEVKQVEFIIGHPSVIERLSLHVGSENGNTFFRSVKGIVTCSEALNDAALPLIRERFPFALVLSRYSNEEVGVIAHQHEVGGDLIIDKFGVFVEVVDPVNFLPVRDGEAGLVLVTDLFSEYFPLCRYNTGDMAVLSSSFNGVPHSLRSVSGRTSEQIFSTKGVPLSSLMLGPSIYKPLSERRIYCQFQFAQTGPTSYELRLSPESFEACESMEAILKGILGEDATVTIRKMAAIPALPSGKRPVVVNEWKGGLSPTDSDHS